ncbi:CBS domain-containing protein [Halioxenophilus aromaticivorans]
MHKLSVLNANFYQDLASPTEDGQLTLASPALDLLADFAKESPVVVDDRTPASQALEMLRRSSAHVLLVLDQAQHFLGVVSFDRLNSQELIKRVSAGHSREDLMAADFLESRNSVKALPYSDFVQSSISDVMLALQNNSLRYCLVVDQQSRKIRGVVSAYAIAKKLGLPFEVSQSASFSEIAGVIYRQFNPDPRPTLAVN